LPSTLPGLIVIIKLFVNVFMPGPEAGSERIKMNRE
jgi:hypothetical protein